MRAVFNSAINFGAFDISVFDDRTGPAVFSPEGSFAFGGTTYDSRYLLPASADWSTLQLSLLGFDMGLQNGVPASGTVGVIRLFQDGSASPVFALSGLTGTPQLPAAADVGAAIRSAGTADDRALLGRLLAGSDAIFLSNGADRAFGGTGFDTLVGNGGADFLSGNEGRDTVFGGAGADTLNGQADNDRLFGGDGADRLIAGRGNDLMNGGGGADTFLFASSDGQDTIRGFLDDIDTIDITITVEGRWQVDLQPQSGDTILTIFREGDPSDVLGLRIVIEDINPDQMTNDILV